MDGIIVWCFWNVGCKLWHFEWTFDFVV